MRLLCSSTGAGTMSSCFTTHCSQISVSESKKNWNSSTSEMPPLKWARTLATDIAAGWSTGLSTPNLLSIHLIVLAQRLSKHGEVKWERSSTFSWTLASVMSVREPVNLSTEVCNIVFSQHRPILIEVHINEVLFEFLHLRNRDLGWLAFLWTIFAFV